MKKKKLSLIEENRRKKWIIENKLIRKKSLFNWKKSVNIFKRWTLRSEKKIPPELVAILFPNSFRVLFFQCRLDEKKKKKNSGVLGKLLLDEKLKKNRKRCKKKVKLKLNEKSNFSCTFAKSWKLFLIKITKTFN